MPIVFRCKHCRQKLSITSRKAGQAVKCPSCAQEVYVPTMDEIAARQAATAAAVTAAPEAAVAAAPPSLAVESLPEVVEPPAALDTTLAKLSRDADGEQPAARAKVAVLEADDDDAFPIRRAAAELEEMDLTPMVDVTFLLLIFFMITASFSLQKTLQIPPPDPDEKGAAQAVSMEDLEENSIIVEIDENNVIIVDDQPLSDPETLIPTLEGKIRSENKAELVLEAADAALHEYVVKVVDAANAVGMQKIRIATRAAD